MSSSSSSSSSISPSLSLPRSARPLLSQFSIAFTRPTFQRAMTLLVGFVLATGRRTVTGALRATRTLWNRRGGGHFSDYHRVLSRARWSPWPLGKVLAALVLERVPEGRPVTCVVDDTAVAHAGDHVYGKSMHRDACRSTRSHKAWLFGHSWVTLAINVRFPFAPRPWALPVLVGLYRSPKLDEQEKRRHKTPIAIARALTAALLHWFPERRFVLVGDGGYASHALAAFAHRHRRRLTLVSLLHPDAHLRLPPPKPVKGQLGRKRIRGAKLPHPSDVVADPETRRRRATVDWYGGRRRRVEFVTGTGHWYKAAEGLVPIRWAFVHDRDGAHDDRYFFSTDASMSPSAIVAPYTGRWSIEVTFQESRAHLGLATPRNRKDKSVLRTAPCLLGLFSVVTLLFHRDAGKPDRRRPRPASDPWYRKAHVTFGDALAHVRRQFWRDTIISGAMPHAGLNKLPRSLRRTLLDHLSRAA
jgi:hypothetical protein